MELSAMKMVFMGTPDFAVASLKALVEAGANVVGVITAPDRPAGRGQQLRQSAVKEFAVSQGLNVLQPTNLKAPEFIDELLALEAELQVVVAFRMLPEVVWNMPPRGTINLHGSLLPQYRGAAPINRAIMNGETVTGVTTFFIRQKIDTGDVLDRKEIPIGADETAGELHDRMMNIGASLLVETVTRIAEDNVEGTAQAELSEGQELKEAPKIFRDDCRIDWEQNQNDVYNHIRGLIPYPAPYTTLVNPEGKSTDVKIHAARMGEGTNLAPGKISIIDKESILVGTKTGSIKVLMLQAAGKKRMAVKDFLNGFQLTEDWYFA